MGKLDYIDYIMFRYLNCSAFAIISVVNSCAISMDFYLICLQYLRISMALSILFNLHTLQTI